MPDVYYWFYVCERGDSMEFLSKEPLGLPTWPSEKCPTCGASIAEVNMKGPEEGGK